MLNVIALNLLIFNESRMVIIRSCDAFPVVEIVNPRQSSYQTVATKGDRISRLTGASALAIKGKFITIQAKNATE